MSTLPPFDDSDLHDDPELLAALSAAFGEDGKDLLSDSHSDRHDGTEHVETGIEPQSALGGLAQLIGDLDQAVSSFDETTDRVIGENAPSTGPRQESRYVVFQIGQQLAAISLNGIGEIDRMPNYTALPGTPAWCLGIANLRGQIVSVTDLAELIGEDGATVSKNQKVMIVRSQNLGASTALVVDRVIGIRNLTEGRINRPEDLESSLAQFAPEIASIGHDQVMLLDPDLIMQHPEMQPFMQG